MSIQTQAVKLFGSKLLGVRGNIAVVKDIVPRTGERITKFFNMSKEVPEWLATKGRNVGIPYKSRINGKEVCTVQRTKITTRAADASGHMHEDVVTRTYADGNLYSKNCNIWKIPKESVYENSQYRISGWEEGASVTSRYSDVNGLSTTGCSTPIPKTSDGINRWNSDNQYFINNQQVSRHDYALAEKSLYYQGRTLLPEGMSIQFLY